MLSAKQFNQNNTKAKYIRSFIVCFIKIKLLYKIPLFHELIRTTNMNIFDITGAMYASVPHRDIRRFGLSSKLHSASRAKPKSHNLHRLSSSS